LIIEVKGMKMAVCPAKCSLKDEVEVIQMDVNRHMHAAPDHRPDVF
jgi:hypothetical protein